MFGGVQEMELSVSFSRTVWHRVGSETGHPSWHCQHSTSDQGAGHWGLPVVSSHCWEEKLSHLPDCLVWGMGVHDTSLSPLCQLRAVQVEGKVPWRSSAASGWHRALPQLPALTSTPWAGC